MVRPHSVRDFILFWVRKTLDQKSILILLNTSYPILMERWLILLQLLLIGLNQLMYFSSYWVYVDCICKPPVQRGRKFYDYQKHNFAKAVKKIMESLSLPVFCVRLQYFTDFVRSHKSILDISMLNYQLNKN